MASWHIHQIQVPLCPFGTTAEGKLGPVWSESAKTSPTGDGPWRDVTQQWIENHRRIIETFESVLDALEREKAP